MKIKRIRVPYYKWTIKVIMAESHKEKDKILQEAKDFGLSETYLDSIASKFDAEAVDGAEVYYNDGPLIILMIVYPHTSTKQLVSTLIHEGRHAADEIIDSTGIEGKESTAYLNEYITYKLVKEYINEKLKETV